MGVLAVARDLLDTVDLEPDEGTVGVVEDTKNDRVYVIEIVRFETLAEAERYAGEVLAHHHIAQSLGTVH